MLEKIIELTNLYIESMPKKERSGNTISFLFSLQNLLP